MKKNNDRQQAQSHEPHDTSAAALQARLAALEEHNQALLVAQARLEAQLKQANDLVELAPVGCLTLTAVSVILQINRAGAGLLGAPSQLLIHQRLDQFISSDLLPAFDAFLQQLASGPGRASCEVALAAAGRDPAWVQLKAAEAPGLPGGSFVCMMLDITERQQAETQLNFQAQLLAGVQDAIIGSDQRLAISYWNPAAEALYGWTAREALGRSAAHLFQTEYSGTTREEALEAIMARRVFQAEVRQRHKDGSWLDIESRVQAQLDPHGQLIGFVAVEPRHRRAQTGRAGTGGPTAPAGRAGRPGPAGPGQHRPAAPV